MINTKNLHPLVIDYNSQATTNRLTYPFWWGGYSVSCPLGKIFGLYKSKIGIVGGSVCCFKFLFFFLLRFFFPPTSVHPASANQVSIDEYLAEILWSQVVNALVWRGGDTKIDQPIDTIGLDSSTIYPLTSCKVLDLRPSLRQQKHNYHSSHQDYFSPSLVQCLTRDLQHSFPLCHLSSVILKEMTRR